MSCHLDDGRRLMTGPLIGVYARYPRFIDRAGGVASIEDRVNFCFTRSLAGRKLPTASRDMRDIVSYLAFLSTGIAKGSHIRGEGITPLPRLASDTARGALLFGPTCARCHGPQGQGTVIGRTVIAPALWGAQSFSIAAGMAREARTAAFIQQTMPYDRPGTLTDQQAFDLAAYILSKPRPDLPGKANDWPRGDAPNDVPYATRGHEAYRAAPLIRRTGDTADMLVPIRLTTN
jgi:thiosulfate dehydrogenase